MKGHGYPKSAKKWGFSTDKFSMGFILGVYFHILCRIYGNIWWMFQFHSTFLWDCSISNIINLAEKWQKTFLQIISLWVLVIRPVTNVVFFTMRVKLPNSYIGQTTCKMVNLPLCTVMNPFKDLSRFWCR